MVVGSGGRWFFISPSGRSKVKWREKSMSERNIVEQATFLFYSHCSLTVWLSVGRNADEVFSDDNRPICVLTFPETWEKVDQVIVGVYLFSPPLVPHFTVRYPFPITEWDDFVTIAISKHFNAYMISTRGLYYEDIPSDAFEKYKSLVIGSGGQLPEPLQDVNILSITDLAGGSSLSLPSRSRSDLAVYMTINDFLRWFIQSYTPSHLQFTILPPSAGEPIPSFTPGDIVHTIVAEGVFFTPDPYESLLFHYIQYGAVTNVTVTVHIGTSRFVKIGQRGVQLPWRYTEVWEHIGDVVIPRQLVENFVQREGTKPSNWSEATREQFLSILLSFLPIDPEVRSVFQSVLSRQFDLFFVSKSF